MTDLIKKIEDLSLNAWPSHQVQFYDGWILRYSNFYTHRTNSVEQLGLSCLPLREKVAFCESIYRRWKTPCIFKITPLGDPALDAFLEKRGYRIEHHTTVMTRHLDGPAGFPHPSCGLRFENRVSRDWIDGLFRLKDMDDPFFAKIVPQMYDAIPMDEIAVSLPGEDGIGATGLGILDRDSVGIYAIHVSPALRRRGIARSMVCSILAEASARGADFAYLQAVTDNTPARSLYRSCGFRDEYSYYFRVKEV